MHQEQQLFSKPAVNRPSWPNVAVGEQREEEWVSGTGVHIGEVASRLPSAMVLGRACCSIWTGGHDQEDLDSRCFSFSHESYIVFELALSLPIPRTRWFF